MTAKEIIEQIKALPADEIQEVVDFVYEMEQDEFSPQETEEILRRGEEAKQGINMSPPFQSLQEALDWYKKNGK